MKYDLLCFWFSARLKKRLRVLSLRGRLDISHCESRLAIWLSLREMRLRMRLPIQLETIFLIIFHLSIRLPSKSIRLHWFRWNHFIVFIPLIICLSVLRLRTICIDSSGWMYPKTSSLLLFFFALLLIGITSADGQFWPDPVNCRLRNVRLPVRFSIVKTHPILPFSIQQRTKSVLTLAETTWWTNGLQDPTKRNEMPIRVLRSEVSCFVQICWNYFREKVLYQLNEFRDGVSVPRWCLLKSKWIAKAGEESGSQHFSSVIRRAHSILSTPDSFDYISSFPQPSYPSVPLPTWAELREINNVFVANKYRVQSHFSTNLF